MTIYNVNSIDYAIQDDALTKTVNSIDYNYFFNKLNGVFCRWGKTASENPLYSPIGPEICDLEITTKCFGINGVPCSFCYKNNTPNGKNMSFDTFKSIINKLPKSICQIAFGADSTCEANPDIWKILEYTKEQGIIPNITVAQIDEGTAEILSRLCGAVAVSRGTGLTDKNICYDSIKRLTDRNMKQTNMHFVLSQETFELCKETLNDILNDKRLKNLNAIVFLSLKQKGRGSLFNSLKQEQYDELIKICLDNKISFGLDSCGTAKFFNSINKLNPKDADFYKSLSEPCESFGMFSSYINVDGIYFPCSFCEGVGEWKDGIDILKCNDFIKDVWYSPLVNKWRNLMIDKRSKGDYCCPIFEI